MYVLTEDLALVIEEYIARYEKINLGTNDRLYWKELDKLGMPSARSYICDKCVIDNKVIHTILYRKTYATKFENADKILCGLGLVHEFQARVPIFDGDIRQAKLI